MRDLWEEIRSYPSSKGKPSPPLSLSLSRFTGPREEERTHGEDGGTTAAVEWPRRAGATVGMG